MNHWMHGHIIFDFLKKIGGNILRSSQWSFEVRKTILVDHFPYFHISFFKNNFSPQCIFPASYLCLFFECKYVCKFVHMCTCAWAGGGANFAPPWPFVCIYVCLFVYLPSYINTCDISIVSALLYSKTSY